MFTWLTNWQNWFRLIIAAVVVILNYVLGWGLSTEAVIGIGAALAIPTELWAFISGLITKLFKKE